MVVRDPGAVAIAIAEINQRQLEIDRRIANLQDQRRKVQNQIDRLNKQFAALQVAKQIIEV
jgi:predicted  nucleic acid-binding Zn-ribbon protein